MSEALSEIVATAERAVAGGEADRSRLAQLLDGVDLAGLGGPEARAYLAVMLDWLGLRGQAMLALRPADGGHAGPDGGMPNLAGILAAGHGDYGQARELFTRALSAAGDGTPLRAKILVNLAALSLLAGEVDSASGRLAQAGAVDGQLGDPATDALLAATEFGIARARGDLPRQREAVSRLNEATRARVAELGADHPLALTAVANLAAADFELAAAEESVENQQRAIAVLEVAAHRLAADLGADHPQALSCLGDLCVADLHLALASGLPDRASRAVRALESAYQRTTAAVGAEHPQAREAAANAASARRALETALADNTGSRGQGSTPVNRRHAAFDVGARRRPDRYRPWARSQVQVADSWPRSDQPVSVALSPAGDRLALSVGQRLTVSDITDGSRVEPRLRLACALAPGLTWSPGGDMLAFRDDEGQACRAVWTSLRPGGSGLGAGSRRGERDGLRPGQRPTGRAGTVPSGPDDTAAGQAEPGGAMGAGADQEPDVQLSPGRGKPGLVTRREPAGLHHGDIHSLGVRYRHRAAGTSIR